MKKYFVQKETNYDTLESKDVVSYIIMERWKWFWQKEYTQVRPITINISPTPYNIETRVVVFDDLVQAIKVCDRLNKTGTMKEIEIISTTL